MASSRLRSSSSARSPVWFRAANPKLSSHTSPFLLAVKVKLPNFCTVTIDEGKKQLFGKDALLAHMRVIEATPEADRTLAMFEITSVFGWLLTRQESATCEGLAAGSPFLGESELAGLGEGSSCCCSQQQQFL